MMLLYATHDLLLHLLLYHQSLRRRCAVRETLLSKLKLLLFLFFLLINCFKMMRLIHLQTIFLPAAAGNVTFYHLDTLTQVSLVTLVIILKNKHTTRFRTLFIHSLPQFVLIDCQ